MTSAAFPDSLQGRLAASAWEAARDALTHYSEENLRRFCMEAAHSIELGGKALLAKMSPVLIADPMSVDSQLYFAGHVHSPTHPKQAIRTISCRQVLDRLGRVLPALKMSEILPIIDARDGSTHYLIDDGDALEGLVVPYLAAISMLGKELDLSDTDIFGHYAELVEKLRMEHSKKVDRTVAAKLARAKQLVTERFEDVPREARDQTIRAIEAGYDLDRYDNQLVWCPACGEHALVSGWHELMGWQGHGEDALPEVMLWAEELQCDVCHLHLINRSELNAAGVDTALEIEGDPDDFFDEDDDSFKDP